MVNGPIGLTMEAGERDRILEAFGDKLTTSEPVEQTSAVEEETNAAGDVIVEAKAAVMTTRRRDATNDEVTDYLRGLVVSTVRKYEDRKTDEARVRSDFSLD